MFLSKCCCGKRRRRMQRSVPILVLGLDNAGKSSIIKRIQRDPHTSVVPTVGFNRAKVAFSSKYEVFLYDLGGSENFRTIWKQYLGTAYGVIFVIDSNDFQRVEENRKVFEELLCDENMKYKPLLLLANKQDLEVTMDEVDIVERLNVHTLVNEYKCPTTIELCNTVEAPPKPRKCCRKPSANQSDGIQIGFRWLMKQIDEYYDDLQLRIEEIVRKEQKEYAMKRENWKRERQLREAEDSHSEEDDDRDDGNPFKPVDQILSAKSLTNGYKHTDESETNVSNFEIKTSTENLLNNTSNNHESSKKNKPKKRKKKVAPLHVGETQDETELSLPPLRLPGRNVNMAWTEETQILSNGNGGVPMQEVLAANTEHTES